MSNEPAVATGSSASRRSAGASNAFFERESRPGASVVSVARRNRHGLPDEEPVMRWLVAGAAVLQTADEGAVWLRSDGRRVERVEWR